MSWVWLIIVGGVVGGLARLLHPGREPMGILLTILIGIASLLIAGAIFSGFWAYLIGVIVAVVLVTAFARFTAHPAV